MPVCPLLFPETIHNAATVSATHETTPQVRWSLDPWGVVFVAVVALSAGVMIGTGAALFCLLP